MYIPILFEYSFIYMKQWALMKNHSDTLEMASWGWQLQGWSWSARSCPNCDHLLLVDRLGMLHDGQWWLVIYHGLCFCDKGMIWKELQRLRLQLWLVDGKVFARLHSTCNLLRMICNLGKKKKSWKVVGFWSLLGSVCVQVRHLDYMFYMLDFLQLICAKLDSCWLAIAKSNRRDHAWPLSFRTYWLSSTLRHRQDGSFPRFENIPKHLKGKKKNGKRTKKGMAFPTLGHWHSAIPWREINLNSWSLERLSLVMAPSMVTCLRSDPPGSL